MDSIKSKPETPKSDMKIELLEDILAEQQDLREAVEKNSDRLDELLHHSKKVNTWIFSQRIKGYLKIFIIIIPIILGIIYIPPLFEDVVNRYRSLLNSFPGFGSIQPNDQVNDNQINDLIKNLNINQ